MKVGILGMGRAGSRHMKNAQGLKHSVIAYDSERRFPGADDKFLALNATREAVLTNADAIIIASPSECHLQDLRDCVAVRKPVLVEKPIGLCGQARDIEDLLSENQLPPVAVGYNLRFHPTIQAIKHHLSETKRHPYYASLWCCQKTDSQGPLTNGCLNEWATHEIDLAQYLVANPLRLIDKHIDRFTVDLGLRTWDGPHCHVHLHSDMLYLGNFRGGILVCDASSYRWDLVVEPVTNDDYKAELASFLSWVETGKHDGILATGEDGLTALKQAERADNTKGLMGK